MSARRWGTALGTFMLQGGDGDPRVWSPPCDTMVHLALCSLPHLSLPVLGASSAPPRSLPPTFGLCPFCSAQNTLPLILARLAAFSSVLRNRRLGSLS